MKDETERIETAAVQDISGKLWWLPKPARHHTIFKKIKSERPQIMKNGCTQGFLTNTRRFVDRMEAYKIAVAAGQVKKILFTEDLW